MKRTTVTEQIRQASRNKLAFSIGTIFGGFVPAASWIMVHNEAMTPLHRVLIGGALLYSALTVYEWGKVAFRNSAKALGFVTLIEGVMVYSATFWLSVAALALLIGVNAVAAGCQLARDEKRATRPKAKARKTAKVLAMKSMGEYPYPMGVQQKGEAF